jgi:hypothetical protein
VYIPLPPLHPLPLPVSSPRLPKHTNRPTPTTMSNVSNSNQSSGDVTKLSGLADKFRAVWSVGELEQDSLSALGYVLHHTGYQLIPRTA